VNHLTGLPRGQRALFPEAIDDYIELNSAVRFIDAFVGTLELQKLDFAKAVPAATGRPAYHPGDLLRLYLYGYLHRVRSSRLLEKECHKNLEVIWLLRTLKPDFKTIADFRRDNKKPLQQTCRQFTLICKKLNLFSGDLVAIDGSKFRAVNSRDKNYNAQKLRELLAAIDAKIQSYLQQLDQSDDRESTENPPLSKEQLQEKIAQLQERKTDYEELQTRLDDDQKQISITDPDSRLMHTRDGAQVCYNVQSAVDSQHKLIVAHEVTNDPTDFQQLSSMAEQAREVLDVKELKVVADKGYYSNSQVVSCQEKGITPFIQKADTSANTKLGLYGKGKFKFEPERDLYLCPAGQELTYRFSTWEKERELRYYRASACKQCPLKSKCTRNKGNRTITREENEGVMETMAARVRSNPQIMNLRKAIVEHPFGTMKRWMNAGYFLCRGLESVATEMSLTVLSYNLKRVLNIVSFEKLMQAVAVRG
jgi:transposase